MVPNEENLCCHNGRMHEDGWTDGQTDEQTGPFPGNNNVVMFVQCYKVGELEQWL